jgi:hypothetical protein
MNSLSIPSYILLSCILASTQELESRIDPVDPLDGTSWELFAHSRTRPPEWLSFRVEFSDGRLMGFGGCNRFEGTYQVAGERFEILEVEWVDRRHCESPEALMERETFLFVFLQAGRRFRMDEGGGGRLFIFRPDGEALTFDPVSQG